jgi:hypothetical protein
MADLVELIPEDHQAEAVFRAWEAGKGLRALSREFALSVREVEQIIDRCLPVFDVQHQLQAFKRELMRLEDLSGEFFAIAKRDQCRDSAHLVCRINERIAAMRGWSPMNIKLDLHTVQTAQVLPKSFDRIREVIYRVARGPDWQPNNGNGAPSNGDNAGGVLSPPDDVKPEH